MQKYIVMTVQKQMKEPLNEPPNSGSEAACETGLSLLARLRKSLRELFADFESSELPPGVFCIESEEQEYQGELCLIMPPNMRPTKWVIQGRWGDSYPVVILERLAQQQIETQHDESSRNKADSGFQYVSFRDRQG